MKLKLVVASMSVLGLISNPTFADAIKHKYQTNAAENYQAREAANYKGEAFPPPANCPRLSAYQPLLDMMSQNAYRAKPTVDCDKPIQFAGGINFDYQMVGPLERGFTGENPNRFALNDAYLNATARLNDWVSGFLEISYSSINADPLLSTAALAGPPFGADNPKPGLYSEAYSTDTLTLQQGIIFIGNLDRSPFFLKIGKQFQDYGRYVIHPLVRSFTQVMTESLQTSAEASFISGWNDFGLHGSGFAFQNTMGKISSSANPLVDSGHHHTNYGGQLGIGKVSEQMGFDVGVGYIYDLMGINDIAYAVSLFNQSDVGDDGNYVKRVQGLSVYAMLNTGPFSFSGHYTTALQHFDPADLGYSTNNNNNTKGAKPWAWDATAAFGFNHWDKSQNLYVGYQESGDAVNLLIPQGRWIAGYDVDFYKNTNLAIEYSRDHDFGTSDGGTGDNTNRVAVRVGVKFG